MQFAGNIYKLGNIVVIKLKIFQFKQVFDIAQVAGDQVIHANNMKIFLNKPVA